MSNNSNIIAIKCCHHTGSYTYDANLNIYNQILAESVSRLASIDLKTQNDIQTIFHFVGPTVSTSLSAVEARARDFVSSLNDDFNNYAYNTEVMNVGKYKNIIRDVFDQSLAKRNIYLGSNFLNEFAIEPSNITFVLNTIKMYDVAQLSLAAYGDLNQTEIKTAAIKKYLSDVGADGINTRQYLNVWIVDMTSTSISGFSSFPWETTDPFHGVILNRKSFFPEEMKTGTVMYTFKSLTHQVGHFLGLVHIFDESNVPEKSPVVDPTDRSSNRKLLTDPSYNPLFPDFMDFTYDKYVSVFTLDQIKFMKLMIATYRSTSNSNLTPRCPILLGNTNALSSTSIQQIIGQQLSAPLISMNPQSSIVRTANVNGGIRSVQQYVSAPSVPIPTQQFNRPALGSILSLQARSNAPLVVLPPVPAQPAFNRVSLSSTPNKLNRGTQTSTDQNIASSNMIKIGSVIQHVPIDTNGGSADKTVIESIGSVGSVGSIRAALRPDTPFIPAVLSESKGFGGADKSSPQINSVRAIGQVQSESEPMAAGQTLNKEEVLRLAMRQTKPVSLMNTSLGPSGPSVSSAPSGVIIRPASLPDEPLIPSNRVVLTGITTNTIRPVQYTPQVARQEPFDSKSIPVLSPVTSQDLSVLSDIPSQTQSESLRPQIFSTDLNPLTDSIPSGTVRPTIRYGPSVVPATPQTVAPFVDANGLNKYGQRIRGPIVSQTATQSNTQQSQQSSTRTASELASQVALLSAPRPALQSMFEPPAKSASQSRPSIRPSINPFSQTASRPQASITSRASGQVTNRASSQLTIKESKTPVIRR